MTAVAARRVADDLSQHQISYDKINLTCTTRLNNWLLYTYFRRPFDPAYCRNCGGWSEINVVLLLLHNYFEFY